ncbi:hypothetical protein JXO59_15760 [candidate division KSB1 bacterium]|nr:hypothetical protein [candidate division KSB1 bacterium]
MNTRINDYRRARWRLILLLIVCFARFESLAAQEPGLRWGFFTEVYDETIYMKRDRQNTITMAQMFEGIRVYAPKKIKWDSYIKFRYGNDANRDFWNNRIETMVGTRVRFFTKIYLAWYSEYVMGEYIKRSDVNAPYGASYEDVRHGLIFWHGWDADPWLTDVATPFSAWSEVYADATFLKKDRKNIIYYGNGKLGLRVFRFHQFHLTPYLVTYLNYDANADFWNNHYDYGAGLRIVPWGDVDLQICLEYLQGGYFNRSGDYENPYAASYDDFRVGFFLWHAWEN